MGLLPQAKESLGPEPRICLNCRPPFPVTGKPVVASKIPPLTEIVIDGETGLLVERGNPKAFAEALTHLLIDPLEQSRMGMRGRERVKEYFTAERMSQETLLLYEELLQRRSAFRSIA